MRVAACQTKVFLDVVDVSRTGELMEIIKSKIKELIDKLEYAYKEESMDQRIKDVDWSLIQKIEEDNT